MQFRLAVVMGRSTVTLIVEYFLQSPPDVVAMHVDGEPCGSTDRCLSGDRSYQEEYGGDAPSEKRVERVVADDSRPAGEPDVIWRRCVRAIPGRRRDGVTFHEQDRVLEAGTGYGCDEGVGELGARVRNTVSAESNAIPDPRA